MEIVLGAAGVFTARIGQVWGMRVAKTIDAHPVLLDHMSAGVRGDPSHSMQVTRVAPGWPVPSLMHRRRVMADRITYVALIAELGDLSRFANPRQLMAYLGLVPSEYSSGASIKRGGLTKAGNRAARRLLIEAAWCYRFPARVSRELLLRQEEQPKPIREIAWKAQLRLCARYRRLARTGKPANIVTTAIARELAGFVWAIARQVTVTTD